MNGLIYDTETTGLDHNKDRIVQHGCLVWDSLHDKVVEARSFLAYNNDFPCVADQEKTHGWNLQLLKKYGRNPYNCLTDINELCRDYQIGFVVAHNGIHFDKRMFLAEVKRAMGIEMEREVTIANSILTVPWLDTQHHVNWPCSKSLLTVAAHTGFINPFPHEALSDCYTLASLLTKIPGMLYGMAQEAAEIRSVVFANVNTDARQIGWDAVKPLNEKLKLKGFKWEEVEGNRYEKSWIKIIKRKDFVQFTSTCDFPVNIIKDLPPADEYVRLVQAFTNMGVEF